MEQFKIPQLRSIATSMGIKIPSNSLKKDIISLLMSPRTIQFRGGSVVKYPEIKVDRTILRKGAWLNSININDTMKFYENEYKGSFKFIGTLPIDFGPEFYTLSLNKIAEKFIGVIFNTGTTASGGKHWISLFINKDERTICFFDSNGNNPQHQIKTFINKINVDNYTILINKNTKQFSEGTCGLFALYFIIERLRGKSCKNLFISKENNDKTMEKLRCKIFKHGKIE